MANWLTLSKLDQWEDAILLSFAYDQVSDAHIRKALADEAQVSQVDVSRDWEDDAWLADNRTIPSKRKHAYRVAALVRQLQNGGRLREAVHLDTFNLRECGFGIGNGHHRIRALQYLGLDCAPFALSGHVSSLRRLLKVAASPPPMGCQHYFEPGLLALTKHDIRV